MTHRTRKSFKGNVYRHLLADAIEANCGYYSHYQHWALSWSVGVHESIPDYDSLMERLPAIWAAHHGGALDLSLLSAAEFTQMQEDWDDEGHQSRLWEWVVEDMRSSVTDDDVYRTYRPETACRYGLPGSHPQLHSKGRLHTMPSGERWRDAWSHTPVFKVTFEFSGRCGKHLVVDEFEGRGTRVSSETLAEAIREDDDGTYSNEWCQSLLAMIHEWDLCFDHKRVSEEFQYQVEFRFVQELEQALDAAESSRKEAAEVDYWASRGIMTEATC